MIDIDTTVEYLMAAQARVSATKSSINYLSWIKLKVCPLDCGGRRTPTPISGFSY